MSETKTEERLSNTAKPKAKAAPKTFVKYVGGATNRVITKADFASIGITADKDREWSFLNEFKLPESHFSDDELDYLLEKDGRFQLVEE